MRVISGYLGGRQFKAPNTHRTHPMSDKIRGALFNVLGDLSGLRLLDAFSGSGAIAIEAVSRGAHSALAIEIDKSAHRTLQENIDTLAINNIKAIRANCSSWSDNNRGALFDIVACDPPYENHPDQLLVKLSHHLKNRGTLVVSYPGRRQPPGLPNLNIVNSKDYGDAQLLFYKKAV